MSTKRNSGRPSAWAASSTVAVIAPGPAISGMASGKAAIWRRSSTACSAVRDWRSIRTPNTISEAIENSSRPPAMRNAGSEMPRRVSSQSPTAAVPIRIAAAISEARMATWRRVDLGNPCVMATKVGTSPTGSTTTNSVTRVEIR